MDREKLAGYSHGVAKTWAQPTTFILTSLSDRIESLAHSAFWSPSPHSNLLYATLDKSASMSLKIFHLENGHKINYLIGLLQAFS